MAYEISFVTTAAFDRLRKRLLTDKQFRTVKSKLAVAPELGDMAPATGGARKLRQHGVRGSTRVIYYYHGGGGRLYFLLCYPKADQADLTLAQKIAVRDTVAAIKAAERSK